MLTGLSAAEVLSSGFRSLHHQRAFAQALAESSGSVETITGCCPPQSSSFGTSPATNLEIPDGVVTAAGALLGLQTDNARMSHKQVEQHRRLKAKQYFDELRCLIPNGTDPKCDRNRVLQIAIEHIKNLRAGKVCVYDSQVDEPANRSRGDHTMMFEMDADDKRPESEAKEEKKLSHNEVEQRRRQQAKQHYDELRALLPNSSKYDKNAVLQNSIILIQQLSGVSNELLARRMHEYSLVDPEASYPSSDATVLPPDAKATSSSIAAGLKSEACALSVSPADVAQMLNGFASASVVAECSSQPGSAAVVAAVRKGRKRMPVKRDELPNTSPTGTPPPPPTQSTRAQAREAVWTSDSEEDAAGEKKRSRTRHGAADVHPSARLTSPSPGSHGGALCLLSECAVQASGSFSDGASVCSSSTATAAAGRGGDGSRSVSAAASPLLCPAISSAWAALCLDPALSARLLAS